jgi:hypothetical protein
MVVVYSFHCQFEGNSTKKEKLLTGKGVDARKILLTAGKTKRNPGYTSKDVLSIKKALAL